jgi:hypothetical protein
LPRIDPGPGAFHPYETFSCDKARPEFFDKWIRARPSATGEALHSAELWQLVKTWEIVQECGLESSRSWENAVPGSVETTDEYLNNAWYQLQSVVGSAKLDWPYLARHLRDLQRVSGRPEPGRLIAMLYQAFESGEPPQRNLDPRILVAPEWASAFAPLDPAAKKALTESLLNAWLDTRQRYPPTAYFNRGAPPPVYQLPPDLRGVAGGRAWEALSQFEANGVGLATLKRLRDSGRRYTALAELYHY